MWIVRVARRRPYSIVGMLIVVAVVAILHVRQSSADSRERSRREAELARDAEIPVAAVKLAPKTRKVVLPGDVRPLRLAVVNARVSGYLFGLAVDVGDRVARNQLLGRVMPPETALELAPLEASLLTRRAIADRLHSLVAGGVAQQDLDRADADVRAAQSAIDRLRAIQRVDTIRAPFAGVVTKRYVDLGALMSAPTGSSRTAQPLVDVSDTSRVRVVVSVGRHDATSVHLGDPLSIARAGDPTHPIAGVITRIAATWIESEVDNPNNALDPGLVVTVTLHVAAPDGVVVPSDAISLVHGTPMVAVIRDDHVHFVVVTIADDDGTIARVIAGLQPGEVVARGRFPDYRM
jgi:RND family efflux transporter MFP subunit